MLPEYLLQAWMEWESELKYLPEVVLPRCYVPSALDNAQVTHNIHVFANASEKAYGL